MEYLVQTYKIEYVKLPEKWKEYFQGEIFNFQNDCSFSLRGLIDNRRDDMEEMVNDIAPTVDLDKVKDIYLDVCW